MTINLNKCHTFWFNTLFPDKAVTRTLHTTRTTRVCTELSRPGLTVPACWNCFVTHCSLRNSQIQRVWGKGSNRAGVFTHRFWLEASAACIQRYFMPWKTVTHMNTSPVDAFLLTRTTIGANESENNQLQKNSAVDHKDWAGHSVFLTQVQLYWVWRPCWSDFNTFCEVFWRARPLLLIWLTGSIDWLRTQDSQCWSVFQWLPLNEVKCSWFLITWQALKVVLFSSRLWWDSIRFVKWTFWRSSAWPAPSITHHCLQLTGLIIACAGDIFIVQILMWSNMGYPLTSNTGLALLYTDRMWVMPFLERLSLFSASGTERKWSSSDLTETLQHWSSQRHISWYIQGRVCCLLSRELILAIGLMHCQQQL